MSNLLGSYPLVFSTCEPGLAQSELSRAVWQPNPCPAIPLTVNITIATLHAEPFLCNYYRQQPPSSPPQGTVVG